MFFCRRYILPHISYDPFRTVYVDLMQGQGVGYFGFTGYLCKLQFPRIRHFFFLLQTLKLGIQYPSVGEEYSLQAINLRTLKVNVSS